MRTEGRRKSTNIEDRRGRGGLPGGPAGIGGIGLIAIVLISLLFGVDPRTILEQMPQQPAGGAEAPGEPYQGTPEEEKLKDFLAVVLADTEDVWTEIFAASGRTYRQPNLVIFGGQVQSACGFASAAVGPFYCPADQKLYIDMSFLSDMRMRFNAPGDFAQAYVVAHEVGHHVQTLLGISEQVRAAQSRSGSQEAANELSVRQELQADCFAGIWANHTERQKQVLEQGDIEEGLAAAAAVGDDRLQQQAQGRVVPESFTHGTSDQRMRWFARGLKTGEVSECDTFAAQSL